MSPRGLIRLGKGRNEEGGTESIELMMDLSLATLLPRLLLLNDAFLLLLSDEFRCTYIEFIDYFFPFSPFFRFPAESQEAKIGWFILLN